MNIILVCISVVRDIEERGRSLEQVLEQYTTYVKPAFEEFTLPVSLPLLKINNRYQILSVDQKIC